MSNTNTMKHWCLGLAGAAMGGALGHFLFIVIYHQGFYAMILPGALLGMGCGLLSGRRSIGLGIVCALLALGLGLWTEWKYFPFKADGSFLYFLKNIQKLNAITLIMIALRGFAGYWFGCGREGGVWKHSTPALEE